MTYFITGATGFMPRQRATCGRAVACRIMTGGLWNPSFANSIVTRKPMPRIAPITGVSRPGSAWRSCSIWSAVIARNMAVPKDLREFIESLNSHEVEYLIVGAHALAFHGFPRYTGDVDVLLRPTRENAERVEQVLFAFSFASLGLRAADVEKLEQ